jgi:hypothetical protein
MIKSLFLALLAAALIAGGAFAVKAFWIEPRSLVVTRADVAVAQWPAEARPLRLAMLADVQPAGPHVTAERVAEVVAQINALEPDLIVFVGGIAARALLGVNEGVTKLRGRRFTYVTPEGRSIPAMVMFHPAYLLRTPAQKRLAWRDLLAIRSQLNAV